MLEETSTFCVAVEINRRSSKEAEIDGRELFRKLQVPDVSSCRHRRALSFALLRLRRARITANVYNARVFHKRAQLEISRRRDPFCF